MQLGDFPSAVSSFTQAISAYSSLSSDPQFLASKGLSEVYQGLENEGLELLDRAIRDVVTFKERRAQVVLRNGGSRASGAGANSVRGKGKGVDKDELPIHGASTKCFGKAYELTLHRPLSVWSIFPKRDGKVQTVSNA